MQLSLSTGTCQNTICRIFKLFEKPVFAGFHSSYHKDLQQANLLEENKEDILYFFRDVRKIIRSLDTTLRSNNIVKIYNKIFSKMVKSSSCEQEVFMISEIICHMDIIVKKLI